ncbi:MAG: phosphoribosylamine--glycine ligase [Terriglobales bacterium]
MKILLLGGGGREHALAWKLRQSPHVTGLWALPGSDGMAPLATPVGGNPCDPAAVVACSRGLGCDLVVIGPEAPLAAGVADALRAAGARVFGPSRAAAQLETSKAFAKEFLARHRIPTARFALVDSPLAGHRALARFGVPVVLKADGLAAGKGVVVAATRAEAESALDDLLGGRLAGAAGQRVVIEECLTGPELSLLAIADGERWRLLPPASDHKRLLEGDRGPNTGGMGAICSPDLLQPRALAEIEALVVAPALCGMAAAGSPFCGVLYCGLMLTPAGPRVLEFNVRFGDPETQAVLPCWDGDLAETLLAAASGRLGEVAPRTAAGAAACVVAASAGYPAAPVTGETISGLDPAGQLSASSDALVFHAGTRLDRGAWHTSGGRVLGVTAHAATLERALPGAYQALASIHFRGLQLRRDIGAPPRVSIPAVTENQ